MNFKKITKCRACKSDKIKKVLNLGDQAFTGKFPTSKNKNIGKSPLSISLCLKCKFVQLSHNFSSSYLYDEEYGYESGINSTMKNHLSKITLKVSKLKKLTKSSIVIDIASNDGTLLNSYNKDVVKVGIDPILKRFDCSIINIPLVSKHFLISDKNLFGFSIS